MHPWDGQLMQLVQENDNWRMRVATGMGIAGVFLFFLLGLRSTSAFSLSLLLVVAGLIVSADRVWRPLSREPLVWLAFLLFLWVFFRGWADVAMADQHGREVDARSIWHHARYGLFVPILFGLWIAAYWRLRHLILLALAINSLVYYVYRWDAIMERWPGGGGPSTTAAFNEGAIVALVMIFLSSGLVVMTLFPARREVHRYRWYLFAVSLTTLAASIAVFIICQARGAWLAFLVTLAIVAVIALYCAWGKGTRRVRLFVCAGLACGLVVTATVVLAAWDIIAARLMRDQETLAQLFSGNISPETVPRGSFGDRLRMQVQGLIDIQGHPLWGVGPASIRDMAHEIWGKPWHGTGDYHNTWLNLAVTMGIPWAVLALAAHAWLLCKGVHQLLVRERDFIMAWVIGGAALAQCIALTFSVRIWGGFAGTSVYILVVALLGAAALRERGHSSARRVDDGGHNTPAAAPTISREG